MNALRLSAHVMPVGTEDERRSRCPNYGEYEISVEVETGTIHGRFPPRALKLVLEWMNLHKAELLEDWQLAKQGQPLKRIAPLE